MLNEEASVNIAILPSRESFTRLLGAKMAILVIREDLLTSFVYPKLLFFNLNSLGGCDTIY